MNLEEAGLVLARRQERFSTDTEIIHLKVSQATALKNFDHQVAVELESGQLKHNQEATPVNDGTNHVPSCLFALQKEHYMNQKQMIFSSLYRKQWRQLSGLYQIK